MECSLCLCLELAAVILVLAMAWRWYRGRLLVDGRHNKCVFITGCDSGFGLALARSLDTKGVPVFAGCLTEDGARKLNEQTSSRVKVIMVDVTKHETIHKAREFIEGTMPSGCSLWGVVNNAGIMGSDGAVEFFVANDYRRLFEVNFLGMTEVNQTFLPLLKQTKGRVVNMCSLAGLVAYPRLAPYAASKHAVLGYSDALRLEKAIWGIKVATVAPGGHKTGLMEPAAYLKMKRQQWDRTPKDIQEEYGEKKFFEAADAWVKYHNAGNEATQQQVVKAYEHALFALHPKSHYLTDTLSRSMYCASLLPRCVIDFALSQFVNNRLYIPRVLEGTAR